MRVYRVSRIAAVRPLDELFERPAGFELTAFWEEWSRAFEQSRPTVDVTVRVSEDVRRFLPGEPRSEADGRVVVAFDDLAEAHRELLRFGADLEVLEPPSCATGSAGRAARWPRCTLSSPVGA
jgi:predicted DNA-binding transcriptional regulator YafY